MADELASNGIVPVTHGSLYAASGLAVPDTIDVFDLDDGYRRGWIKRGGDKVVVDGEAAEIRLSGGLNLSYPEAVALIAGELMEGARDGRGVAELMGYGKTILTVKTSWTAWPR